MDTEALIRSLMAAHRIDPETPFGAWVLFYLRRLATELADLAGQGR
jgi:hypothetical protein